MAKLSYTLPYTLVVSDELHQFVQDKLARGGLPHCQAQDILESLPPDHHLLPQAVALFHLLGQAYIYRD